MATVVLGLDGGNWETIEPWIRDGTLPTIGRMREEGLWATSESVLPPVTCPNWKCYATSKPPDEHGVYWWEVVDTETLETAVPDATSFTAPELWDYLNDEGYRTGVVNLPLSDPPRPVDGVMVANASSRETEFTSPPSLADDLVERYDYRLRPAESVGTNENRKGVEATLDLIESRFEVARELLAERDLDFLHLTVFYVNVLQHFYGDDRPVREAWERIDEGIDRFLDDGHTVFLMSDHGTDRIDTVFYANEWLRREGYLTLDSSLGGYLYSAGLTQERLSAVVDRLRVEELVRRYVPRRLIRAFPEDEGVTREAKFDGVDADASTAVASGQGLIYVLADPGTPAHEETVDRLTTGLRALTTDTGGPVAAEVHRGADYYPDGDPRYRPDVVFDQGPGIHTSDALGGGAVFDSPNGWAGENVREGIFLAHGPEVRPAGEVDPISILDIAPTVLYSMGLDVPSDFRGSPVTGVNTSRGEVTYRSPLPDIDHDDPQRAVSESTAEQLADLGYLE